MGSSSLKISPHTIWEAMAPGGPGPGKTSRSSSLCAQALSSRIPVWCALSDPGWLLRAATSALRCCRHLDSGHSTGGERAHSPWVATAGGVAPYRGQHGSFSEAEMRWGHGGGFRCADELRCNGAPNNRREEPTSPQVQLTSFRTAKKTSARPRRNY